MTLRIAVIFPEFEAVSAIGLVLVNNEKGPRSCAAGQQGSCGEDRDVIVIDARFTMLPLWSVHQLATVSQTRTYP